MLAWFVDQQDFRWMVHVQTQWHCSSLDPSGRDTLYQRVYFFQKSHGPWLRR